MLCAESEEERESPVLGGVTRRAHTAGVNVESEPGRSPVGNMSRTSGNAALEPASITFYSRGENLVFASKA